MILAKSIKQTPCIGDIKFRRRFAFTPHRVKEGRVLFAFYYKVYEYKMCSFVARLTTVILKAPKWVHIGNSLRNHKNDAACRG
jgi:hypothetical protein